MTKRMSLAIIALLMGSWLLFDSIHAISTSRFFGVETPGPWSEILNNLNIDPVSFAPGLLALGILWLFSLLAVAIRHPWWRGFYGTTAFLSLWYLPFGTALSLIALVLIMSGMLPRRFQRYRIVTFGTIFSIIITLVLMALLNFAGEN